MMTLFDDEQILEAYVKDREREIERETERETEIKTKRETEIKTAERMIKKGKMTLEEIAECVPSLSFDELRELEAEVM